MAIACIGLGSNLGRRMGYLKEALRCLERESLSVCKVSPLYETVPVGGPPQGLFLNACASISTTLPPVRLLRQLQHIENNLGRIRREQWGPRTIDLDLLLYEKVIMHTPSLLLPHPRLAERAFVLHPLADIAPTLEIPGTGKSVGEMLRDLPPAEGVKLYRTGWRP